MTQYQFSELHKAPQIHWIFSPFFSPLLFQNSAYWQKQMKWVNIPSMNDEEAVARIPNALLHWGLSLRQARHIITRHSGRGSFPLTD